MKPNLTLKVQVGNGPLRVYTHYDQGMINRFITSTSEMRERDEHFDTIPIRVEVS